MEISEKEMLSRLSTLLLSDEKLIYPVFGAVKRQSNKVGSKAVDMAYIALTSLDRLILYKFDGFSSYNEYYTFDTLIMGDVSSTNSGQYMIELSFLTEKGTKDLNIVFPSKVNGRDFPQQEINSELLFTEIDMKIG